MESGEKLKLMAEVRRSVVDYLQDQLEINTAALKAYDPNPIDDADRDAEVKRVREIQAFILRDRVTEITRHIAVIKRMYPDA